MTKEHLFSLELKKFSKRLKELEHGVMSLNPTAQTFIFEFKIYKQRIGLLSVEFSNLISNFSLIRDPRGACRRKMLKLIEQHNRLHDHSNSLGRFSS